MAGAIHGAFPQNAVYECIVFDYIHICKKNHMGFSNTIENFETIESHYFTNQSTQKVKYLINDISQQFKKDLTDAIKLQILGEFFQLMGIILSERSDCMEKQKKKAKNHDRIKEILSYIKQNYNENITLNDLAQKSNLNSKYLCTVFKQLTGKTPIDYLIYYRIECACEQLVFTDNSITEIALACGFNDISYFIKKFHKLKHTTPLKYRETFYSQS